MPESSSNTSRSSPFGRYLLVSALLSVIGIGTIGYFAVHQWMRPITPLVLAATALLLPLVSFNAVVALLVSDSDQPVVTALRPALVASIAIGVLGLGAGAAWLSPEVRHRALGAAADRGIRQAPVGALEDPADRIVSAACSRLFDLGIGGQRQTLLELLDRRPGLAERCLASAPDNEQVEEVGQVLAERWHEQLLSDAANSGRACRLTRHLPNLPRAPEAGIPALVSCTLQASDPARSCCTKTLSEQVGTGAELADAFGSSVVKTVAERLAAPLVQASLHQLQLSDEAKARAVRLGLTSPEMRRFTAGFACASTLKASTTDQVTRQLTAWLDDRSCQAGVTNVEDNIRAWHRICRHLGEALGSSDEPADAICDAARLNALEQCRQRAIHRVRGAYAGAQKQFMQAEILAGVAMRRDRLTGSLGFLGRLADSDQEFDGALRDIMSRMKDDEFREQVEKITVADSQELKAGVDEAESVDDYRLSEEVREEFDQVDEGDRARMERLKRLGGPDLRNKINLGASGLDGQQGAAGSPDP